MLAFERLLNTAWNIRNDVYKGHRGGVGARVQVAIGYNWPSVGHSVDDRNSHNVPRPYQKP